MKSVTRRQFIKTAGGVTLATVAMSGIAGSVLACTSTKAAPPPTTNAPTTTAAATAAPQLAALPWPYKKIDPIAAAERAYTAYYNGGCMYGAFEGIVGELQQLVGAPYTTFPSTMMKYGGAGISGWGTICGCLNGIAAAIYLMVDPKATNPIINDVFGWYGTTGLPNYKPAKPKFTDIKTSVANSQLCHISVTTWSNSSGFKALSPERAERCAWLTSSVVKHTVELLNAQADGSFKSTFAVPASVTGCLSCHGKGGLKENVHASNATTCTNCHDNISTGHPAK